MKILVDPSNKKVVLVYDENNLKPEGKPSAYSERRALRSFCRGWASLGNVSGRFQRDVSRSV